MPVIPRTKWREVISLAAPVVISKLSFTAMGLVDTAMVGRLGATFQAAVGIATTYMFTLCVFGLGSIGVINTFVSQHHGADQPRMCGIVLGHGLRLTAAIAAITWLILLLFAPLFGWVGLSDGVATAGYTYLFHRILGLPGVMGYWAYNAYLEGLGKTRTPMLISLVANLLNVALDYVLIFGLGPIDAMGVEGAGLATAISNLFMFGCFLVVVHRRRNPYRRFGANAISSPMRRSIAQISALFGVRQNYQNRVLC